MSTSYNVYCDESGHIPRSTYVLLWTAYTVERTHRREKLRREYQAYQNELTPP